MCWIVSSHRVRLLSSLVTNEPAARSDAVPLEVWMVRKRVLHSLSLHGLYMSFLPPGMHCFAALIIMLQKAQ